MRRPPSWLIAALVLLFAVGWYCRRQISNENFLYAGSDTYGFLKLADELRRDHRYALGPPPEPLSYVRPPLYPIFLALVKGDRVAIMSGGDGWWPIVNAQRWIDLLLTGAFVYLLGAAFGRGAGVLSYAMIMIFPFTMMFFPAVFAETLAICFTVAAFALVASESEKAARLRYAAAGVVAGLGTLLRQDTILLLPPLLLAAWLQPRPRQVRVRLGAWLMAGFAIAFAPWPARNLVQFGRPFLLGTHADRYYHPVANHSGFYNWLATWAVEQDVNPRVAWCFYDPGCSPIINSYPPAAFESPEERVEVDRLLALRRSERFSPRVSDGFQALANARRHRHPIDNFILLPARRAWSVWINEHDDITHTRLPWPELYGPMKGKWSDVALGFCLAVALSAALLIRRPGSRRLALVLFGAIVLRTWFLAYFFYVEPRYTVEVMPLGLVLIAGALALLPQGLAQLLPQRKAS